MICVIHPRLCGRKAPGKEGRAPFLLEEFCVFIADSWRGTQPTVFGVLSGEARRWV